MSVASRADWFGITNHQSVGLVRIEATLISASMSEHNRDQQSDLWLTARHNESAGRTEHYVWARSIVGNGWNPLAVNDVNDAAQR